MTSRRLVLLALVAAAGTRLFLRPRVDPPEEADAIVLDREQPRRVARMLLRALMELGKLPFAFGALGRAH